MTLALVAVLALAAGWAAVPASIPPAPPPAALAAPPASGSRAEAFLDRLEALRRVESDAGRTRQAREILTDDPPEEIRAACLAYLALERGAPDSAKVLFDRYLEIAGDPVPGSLLLADEWDRRRRADLAGGIVRRALERAPGEALLHARLAAMHLARGDTIRANAALEQAAWRQGALVPVARDLAHLYGRHARLGDALSLLFRLAPRADTPAEYAAVQCELGVALLASGDTLESRAALREAWSRGDREVVRAMLQVSPEDGGPESAAWLRRAGEASARILAGWDFSSAPAARVRLAQMREHGETSTLRSTPTGW